MRRIERSTTGCERRVRSATNGRTSFSAILLEINITLSRFILARIVSREWVNACVIEKFLPIHSFESTPL